MTFLERRTARALLIGVVLHCAAATAGAQENIEPDRPAVTNGTHIVDIGLLQIEVGGIVGDVLGGHGPEGR